MLALLSEILLCYVAGCTRQDSGIDMALADIGPYLYQERSGSLNKNCEKALASKSAPSVQQREFGKEILKTLKFHLNSVAALLFLYTARVHSYQTTQSKNITAESYYFCELHSAPL